MDGPRSVRLLWWMVFGVETGREVGRRGHQSWELDGSRPPDFGVESLGRRGVVNGYLKTL